MGDLVKGLFGGSSSKTSSNSSNQSYNFLQNALGPSVTGSSSAMGAIGDFLGLNGADGTANSGAALQNYHNSTGFNDLLNQSTNAITNSAAAKGLFQSGATGKAINQNAQQLAGQSTQNYLGNLQALSQLGLGAAGTIAGAGAQSSSTGNASGTNGIFSSINPLKFLSDQRLKRDIVYLGPAHLPNGRDIALYAFRYKWSPFRHIGVMAQDVAVVRPEALGRKIFGFMTVDYAKLFGE